MLSPASSTETLVDRILGVVAAITFQLYSNLHLSKYLIKSAAQVLGWFAIFFLLRFLWLYFYSSLSQGRSVSVQLLARTAGRSPMLDGFLFVEPTGCGGWGLTSLPLRHWNPRS